MPRNSILVGFVGAGIQASQAPRLHEEEERQGLWCRVMSGGGWLCSRLLTHFVC
jgi:hypothetical protein